MACNCSRKKKTTAQRPTGYGKQSQQSRQRETAAQALRKEQAKRSSPRDK